MDRRLFVFALLSLLTATGQADWKLRATGGPALRYECGMSYDSSRGVTVMYGGANVGGLLGDTWEWNGSTWKEVALIGPNPNLRAEPAFAYDSDNGVTVMFGGYGGTTSGAMNATTWLWNGAAWSQLNVTGPSGRDAAGMAYDSTRHEMVLFGGSTTGDNSGVANETWTLSGSTWTKVSTSGPSARYCCRMAYDTFRHRVVLFGGVDVNGNILGDTWEWNGTTWSEVSNGDILPRTDYSVVFDQLRNRTVLFSGVIGSQSSAVVQGMETWDGTNWRYVQTQKSGIPAMRDPGMCYDSGRNRIVLFGGELGNNNLQFTSDTWEWFAEPTVSQVSLPIVTSGKIAAGTVYLTGPAGADGTVVTFTSDDPSVLVTPSIRILPGQKQATFYAQTVKSSAAYLVQITAATDNTSMVGTLQVSP